MYYLIVSIVCHCYSYSAVYPSNYSGPNMIRLMTSIDMILCVFVPDALMTVLVMSMEMLAY